MAKNTLGCQAACLPETEAPCQPAGQGREAWCPLPWAHSGGQHLHVWPGAPTQENRSTEEALDSEFSHPG